METGSWAGLLPVWILGAPLLGAIIEWMRTPKVRTHRRDDEGQTAYSGSHDRSAGGAATATAASAGYRRDAAPTTSGLR